MLCQGAYMNGMDVMNIMGILAFLVHSKGYQYHRSLQGPMPSYALE
jgi:hypothetical protein